MISVFRVSFLECSVTPVDTAVEGVYLGEFEVTWPASKIQSYPSIGYIDIEIVKDLS